MKQPKIDLTIFKSCMLVLKHFEKKILKVLQNIQHYYGSKVPNKLDGHSYESYHVQHVDVVQ